MNLSHLDDATLRAAAARGEQELARRKRERKRHQQRQKEQQRQQQARRALESLPREDLERLAEDPHQMSHTQEVRTWQLVPRSVWKAGWSKGQIVETAREIVEDRQPVTTKQPVYHASHTGRLVNIGGMQIPAIWLVFLLIVAFAALAGGSNG